MMIDSVLHQCDSHFDIFLNVDMHHEGGDESGAHHKEGVRRSDEISLFLSIIIELQFKLPDAKNHTKLDQLDNQGVLKDIRFLLTR